MSIDFITMERARALAALIVATRGLDIKPDEAAPDLPAVPVPDASWLQGPAVIAPPVRSQSPREYGESRRKRRKK